MSPNEEQAHKDDIQLALTLCKTIKWTKLILAIFVTASYFAESAWLTELIILSVLLSLLMPLGFFDVFIQKLLEYNTRLLEDRQRLNAEEANKYFEKVFSDHKKL